MKRSGAALALAAAVGVVACGDTTAPTPHVEIRLAHAAPGAGAYDVLLDNELLVESLSPLQYTQFPIRSQDHVFSFEQGGAELTAEVPVRDITGVIVMDASDPVANVYGLDHNLGEERTMVINADSAEADLTVSLITEDGADTTAVTVAPGEGELVTPSPPPGTYSVTVQQGETGQPVPVQDVVITNGDHGFLTIIPGLSDTRFARFLF